MYRISFHHPQSLRNVLAVFSYDPSETILTILITCEFHRTSKWFSPQTMRIAFSRWRVACTCHMHRLHQQQWVLKTSKFVESHTAPAYHDLPPQPTCLPYHMCKISSPSLWGGRGHASHPTSSNKSRTCHPKLTDV